jgi:glycosyltransferase involved in cell wall biosynthesis
VRRSPGVDVLLTPGYIPPVGGGVPYAITLHDLMYLKGGANHSPARAAYFRLIRSQLIRSRCIILTVSEYSKHQILEWTDGKTAVHVVGNGVSPIESNRVQTEEGRQGDSPRLLIVASERPNKNLVRQLLAADRALLSLGGQVEIVLPEPPSATLVEQISAMRNKTVVSVRLSDADLWDRYRCADVLLSASLQEGFGLPAIEAMSARCPVVYSDVGGLPEVVDGCGVRVDPTDEQAIADGILSVFDNPGTTARLIEAAHQRSMHFTWERVVERIDLAMESLVA